MTNRQAKRAIRLAVIARVLAMSPDDRAKQEAALVAAFPDLPGLAGADTVLLYASAFPEEFDTRPMLEWTLGAGKRLICPRVDRAEGRLDLCVIGDLDRDFAPGALNIPEPRLTAPRISAVEMDWVLVPGVAYDRSRNRIGRGAGHYDRLLPTLRPDAPRWSLAFDEQWVESIPAQPHDQPLDGIVSPGKCQKR